MWAGEHVLGRWKCTRACAKTLGQDGPIPVNQAEGKPEWWGVGMGVQQGKPGVEHELEKGQVGGKWGGGSV